MAQILVRRLDKTVVERQKRQAETNGRSLEAEVRRILEEAAEAPKVDWETARKMAEEFRRRFGARTFDDSTEIIRAFRDGKRDAV
jgi:plasmid stability protein